MKYLRKYNESNNYQKIIDILRLHLEDNPYFEVIYAVPAEVMTGKNDGFLYTNTKTLGTLSPLRNKLRQYVSDINRKLFDRIGKKYDFKVVDITAPDVITKLTIITISIQWL